MILFFLFFSFYSVSSRFYTQEFENKMPSGFILQTHQNIFNNTKERLNKKKFYIQALLKKNIKNINKIQYNKTQEEIPENPEYRIIDVNISNYSNNSYTFCDSFNIYTYTFKKPNNLLIKDSINNTNCKNKKCNCNIFINIADYNKKYIFYYVTQILEDYLLVYKQECKKSNLGLCSNFKNEINDNFEKNINFIKNFLEFLKDPNNENINNYLCILLKENTYLLKNLANILFYNIENHILDNQKNFKNTIKFLFTNRTNDFNLKNNDYINLIEFLSNIYKYAIRVNSSNLNEITYKQYKLAIFQIIKDETINNEEKNFLIKNILEVSKKQENYLIYEKLEIFTKKIF